MISFFRTPNKTIIAVQSSRTPDEAESNKLKWLFGGADLITHKAIDGTFTGPRKEMITPWSTSAVEIASNMNISGIERIEEFFETSGVPADYDRMLQRVYNGLDQEIFSTDLSAAPVIEIKDIEKYNQEEGLALSPEEVEYLTKLAEKLGRNLTDGEVFGFSQVNSEHCRHKIFNGIFIIDGTERKSSLFGLIKKTSSENPNLIVSAYKDNCAFIEGPDSMIYHPSDGEGPSEYIREESQTVISLKAETHNFPTTVEPFNGAATGSGGEIRDRIAGGRGSFPIAGTAVYMTSYPRFGGDERSWEKDTAPRKWLYQSPSEILIKASNGASDFGNKFGQPLICGSLLTFEYSEKDSVYGYDKVIMLAGGIGYAKKEYAFKSSPEKGDKIVLMGGDNYRIGMGGGAVSSVNTGEFDNSIELNAIQRSNPEMQKRVYNAIRSLAESRHNTIVSIHDHGAGGHLNCLSELVEDIGGDIDTGKLPKGDPTLSAKELIGNESQERMGLVMKEKDTIHLKAISERERAPMYVIGEATGKHNFTLKDFRSGETPIDLSLADMFGSAPKTIMRDTTVQKKYRELKYENDKINDYLKAVLQLESVACKDWLTNKVDRSVSGLIATQQTIGEIQLPLSNLGVTETGYGTRKGVATSIGHAPAISMIDAAAGSRISISEALTNLVWTPLKDGIRGISLSANWMWPCRNEGEDARLYQAVEAASNFAIELGINIPTGKDSLSMTQKYPDGQKVVAPGTVIISTVAPAEDVTSTVTPLLKKERESSIFYIPFYEPSEKNLHLGGSSFAQATGNLGNKTPDINSSTYFRESFEAIQEMIKSKLILSGHDISSGGLVTALLELNFPNNEGGITADLSSLGEKDPVKLLFSEAPGVIVQVKNSQINQMLDIAEKHNITSYKIGSYSPERNLDITIYGKSYKFDIDNCRDIWFKTSYLMDKMQVGEKLATSRFSNYKIQPLKFKFPDTFSGKEISYKEHRNAPKAAVIREKGTNGEREMAWALSLAGFSVKDVHMTDLVTGRETLEDVNMIVFAGGFSNADTLGSAKGWAGAFIYNEKASESLKNFYEREDTLSLGVCNGCQLMAELGLITPDNPSSSPKMLHNDSHKYESAFVGVSVQQSPSVLLKSLENSSLGIWVAHGEGKFHFPGPIDSYNIALRYNYQDYPANPNGSPEGVAAVCSRDGRHLAMMPHPERCLYPHNWAYYPYERKEDRISPWIELFINGKEWIQKKIKQ
jgi:phosphoribosylformylglycinamidine synthase